MVVLNYLKQVRALCNISFSQVFYVGLCFIRIILCCVPQFGYIHPDEFFQSVEVVAGDVFNIDVNRPWEFNTSYPVRSIFVTHTVIGVPFLFMKVAAPFLNLWFGLNILTPFTIIFVPRFVMCVCSFVVDYSLLRICRLYGQNCFAMLSVLSSSYVMIVFGTRTFSNTFEMILLSFLLGKVAECMLHSNRVICQEEQLTLKYREATTSVERVKYYKLRSILPKHSFKYAFRIAAVCIIGVFNRPTFIVFAFPPLFFWLFRGMGSKVVGLQDFHLRIMLLIVSGLPFIVLIVVVDSVYYGHLTFSEIITGEVGLENFVVTPLNFIKYNLNTENLSSHGIHPRYLHILVNIPLLFNVLGIFGIVAAAKSIYRILACKWSKLVKLQSINGLMTTSIVFPVLILSFIPHQEARFLIPLILPFVFMFSNEIYCTTDRERLLPRQNCRSILFIIWCMFNILLTIFFGFLHQGGVYPLATKFYSEMRTKAKLTAVHLVTSHTYSLPISLLLLENSKRSIFDKETGRRYRLARSFHSHELGSLSMIEVVQNVNSLLKKSEEKRLEKKLDYNIYLAIPASKIHDFGEAATQYRNTLSYTFLFVYYLHVSTEAPPSFSFTQKCSKELQDCSKKYNIIENAVHQLGLVLLSIQKKQ